MGAATTWPVTAHRRPPPDGPAAPKHSIQFVVKKVSVGVLLALPVYDKIIGLEGHVPAHQPGVGVFHLVDLLQGHMVSHDHKPAAPKVIFALVHHPADGQCFTFEHCIVSFGFGEFSTREKNV